MPYQINIQKDSTALSCYKIEVNNTAIALRSWLTDVCSNPALMLDFKPSVQGVTTINLTQGEAVVKFPPLRENIAPSWIMLAVSWKSLGPTQLVQFCQVQVRLHPCHQLQLHCHFPQT